MNKFLKSLDERLFELKDGTYRGRACKNPISNDEKISEEEVKEVLGLLNKQDYLMIPTNINYGFREAFSVYKVENSVPGIPLEVDRVLTFAMKQMPESISWENMAEHYMQERNLELCDLAGFRRPKASISHYVY